MRSLRHHAIAAATALLAFASPAFTQVSDYHEIKTPTLRSFTAPQPKRVQLANGMVILLQEDHELPLVRGIAMIRGGSRDVPAGKTGLVSILGQSWRTGGTESKTGDQLDDLLEARAARVETSGGEDSTRVSFDVLKGDLDFVLPIYVELLQKPAFRQEKIDLAKTQARSAISRRNDDPQGIRSREATKLGYGADSPYAAVPEYETINSITRDDLLAFHKAHVAPNNIILGVVGDFDSAQMEQKLRSAFGSWPKGPEASKSAPSAGTPAAPGVYFVAKDDVTQANIAVVQPATLRRNDPDYYAATVMNEILSGGFSGRLMNNIRSKAGLAYGVGGGLGAGWDRPTLFNVSMSTKSQSTLQSIDLLKQEISNLQTQPFTAEELQQAKDSILNAFVFTMDSRSKVLNQRMLLEFYGYPADYWQKYQQGIQNVTAADVERVAKKYVRPNQLALLVVGNEKDFEKPLSSLGEVKTIDVTIPEPGQKPAAPPAAGSTTTKTTTTTTTTITSTTAPATTSPEALALYAKVQSFVGGKAKLDAMKSVKTSLTTQRKTPMGEMEIEMEQTMVYPDSAQMVMKTPMGEQTLVITPSAAFAITPAGPQDLPSSAATEVRNQSKLDTVTVLKYPEHYTFAIAGTEKVGDVNAQILTITRDGASEKWWIDPATGRILRSSHTGRQGEQVTEYGEWKDFGGLTMPSSATTTVGGEKVGSVTVKSIEVNPTVDMKTFEKPVK